MGANLGKGVIVEPYAVVAAGASVPENTVVSSGQVFAGNPAQYLRDLSQEEKHQISEYLIEMQQLAQIYFEETELSHRELVEKDIGYYTDIYTHPIDRYTQFLNELGLPTGEMDDMEVLEHRIPTPYNQDQLEFDLENPFTKEDSQDNTYNPYYNDLSKYPEIFQMYGENYDKYQKVKERFDNEPAGEAPGEHALTKDKPKDLSPWEKKYDDAQPKYTGETFI